MLYYPADIYFFVNKENEALAHRIEKGMEALIDNGKVDPFFYNHPRVNAGLEQLKSRRIIELKNPYLRKRQLIIRVIGLVYRRLREPSYSAHKDALLAAPKTSQGAASSAPTINKG